MDKAISIFIEVFTRNPLTVTLAVLGVICVVLAIIGRIPPMDIKGTRAVILGLFGAGLIVAAIALAWLMANSSSAGQPQPGPITAPLSPTSSNASSPTPVPLPQITSIVDTPRSEVQKQPSATPMACDQNPIISERAPEGTKKTYVRCPVGDVEYVIQPDDFLTSIVLDCPDTGQQSISFKKNEQLSQGELLAVYDSARFTSRQGCRVYITIVNTVSDLMGYRLRQELR